MWGSGSFFEDALQAYTAFRIALCGEKYKQQVSKLFILVDSSFTILRRVALVLGSHDKYSS